MASFSQFTDYDPAVIIRENVELSIKVTNPSGLSEGKYYFDIRIYTEDDRPWYSNDPYGAAYPPTNKK